MKKITILLISCLFISNLIQAQAVNQAPLNAELMWMLGRVANPVVSPDGKTILYGVRRFNIQENKGFNTLYAMPIAGGEPKEIAKPNDKVSNPVWHPSGKKIFFLSTKSGSSQVWVMNPDGTEKEQVSFTDTDITNLGFAPNGVNVWVTRDVKTMESFRDQNGDLDKTTARIYDDLMYRHWDHWEDQMSSHVFHVTYNDDKKRLAGEYVDLLEGEPYDSPLMPFGDADQIAWSPDGKKIAYTCKKLSGTQAAMSTNSDIYVYDLATKKTINLSEGMMGYDTRPAFSPDGSSITWLSMETPKYEADRNRLFVYEFKSGTKTELTGGFDYTIDSYQWSPSGKEIYFISGINATDQIWSITTDTKKKPVIRQITTDIADYTGFSLHYDGKNTTMVAARMSMSEPTELYRIDLKTGKPTQLTFTNQELLSGVKMGKVEKRMVKATDGKEILTWVIYPPNFDPNKKYPALLYCQGGPQSTVSQFFSYRWNFQLMAANEYIIVAPNRRGLPSFGTEWNRQISGDWGGQAMQDLLSAIDDVSNEPYVDKKRLGAVGASFGGYSVYWLAGHHNKRFSAFVSHCGVFNLESMYGTTEELFFADFDMGGAYFDKPTPKTYTDFNPKNFVEKWDTPILVIHNDLDYRVPISQGMEAFTAARLRGIPARFLSFEDENHWVTKPQNSIMWYRTYFNWLDMWLRQP
ncbi:MAG: prolyl oligopeptidase family serine peptidase [Bacteroidia bacterium]